MRGIHRRISLGLLLLSALYLTGCSGNDELVEEAAEDVEALAEGTSEALDDLDGQADALIEDEVIDDQDRSNEAEG